MIFRFALLAAIFASLTFAPMAIHKPEAPIVSSPVVEIVPASIPATLPDSLASTSSFYSFRRDLRKCASPRCGGFFVKLVNQSRTRCADNRSQPECYVASIEWGGQTETDNDRALLRGTIRRQGQFGVLRVSEVWKAASDNQPSGIFFRVRDRGVRCIAAPCPTHHEARLNSTASRNIAGVDLSGAGAPDNVLSEATAAMTSTNGILVSGDHAPVTGPAGRSQMLKATQFYVRAAGSTGSIGAGETGPKKPCMKTGCSGQVCADKEVITTCEYRTEYECYKKAACERQANGECGFTQTAELTACLKRSR
jgi:eight-cysteine-cluster-containing protein